LLLLREERVILIAVKTHRKYLGAIIFIAGIALLIPNNLVIRAIGVAMILIGAGIIYPLIFKEWLDKNKNPR
jgi:disulfide bond formation protein DsbB